MPDEDTQGAGQPDNSQGDTTPENGQVLDPQTLLHQKNHWKDKAVDPETGKTYKELLEAERTSRASTSQPASAPSRAQLSPTSNPSPAPDDEWKQRTELRLDGYSSEEADAIMQLGGRKAIDNPIVQEAIASIRKKARSDAATPTDTARSPVYKKYTQAELDSMTAEQLEKILPHAD